MNSCAHCRSDDPTKELWVQCDLCPQWVHVSCVPLECVRYEKATEPLQKVLDYPTSSKEISRFLCGNHGEQDKLLIKPAHAKKRRNENIAQETNTTKRRYRLRSKQHIDYIALNEGDDVRLKNKHLHTDAFLRCFEKWKNTSNVIKAGEFRDNFRSLHEPLKVLDPENSGMKIPEPTKGDLLNIDEITAILGDDYPVDVMDIQTQQNERWTMSQWNQYLSHTKPENRDRVRNVISLEVSHVKDLKIERPRAVEENDLVNIVWESFGDNDDKPKVTRYVLMSAGNSYTDFHLDFAGTSVYYNLVSGRKMFLLFPPSESNLKIYSQWCCDMGQNVVFLGDLLDDGIAMELTAGDLFMIPSGYIHAVYTPIDSLIVGGNFLTLRDIETQLQVVNLERMTKVPKRFTYPNFDLVMGKCCEWAIAQKDSSTVSPTALAALVKYMDDPATKYKPINYPSKRALIKHLHLLLSTQEKPQSPQPVQPTSLQS